MAEKSYHRRESVKNKKKKKRSALSTEFDWRSTLPTLKSVSSTS